MVRWWVLFSLFPSLSLVVQHTGSHAGKGRAAACQYLVNKMAGLGKLALDQSRDQSCLACQGNQREAFGFFSLAILVRCHSTVHKISIFSLHVFTRIETFCKELPEQIT
jgi:uncharacterized MAPEG superfamily protein